VARCCPRSARPRARVDRVNSPASTGHRPLGLDGYILLYVPIPHHHVRMRRSGHLRTYLPTYLCLVGWACRSVVSSSPSAGRHHAARTCTCTYIRKRTAHRPFVACCTYATSPSPTYHMHYTTLASFSPRNKWHAHVCRQHVRTRQNHSPDRG
jgi:hypothetical protein